MHKIKVKPEGREGVWIPDKESLKEFIKSKKFENIHNFIPIGAMMLGADHAVENVLTDIDNSERLAVLTGDAAGGNMNHALSIITDNKMEMYDIGEVTEKDLEIL